MFFAILSIGLIVLFLFRYILLKQNKFPNAELLVSQLENICD